MTGELQPAVAEQGRDPAITGALHYLIEHGIKAVHRQDRMVRLDGRQHVVRTIQYVEVLERELEGLRGQVDGAAAAQAAAVHRAEGAEARCGEFRLRTGRVLAGGRLLRESGEGLRSVLSEHPGWRFWRLAAWRRQLDAAVEEWTGVAESYDHLTAQTGAWIHGDPLPNKEPSDG